MCSTGTGHCTLIARPPDVVLFLSSDGRRLESRRTFRLAKKWNWPARSRISSHRKYRGYSTDTNNGRVNAQDQDETHLVDFFLFGTKHLQLRNEAESPHAGLPAFGFFSFFFFSAVRGPPLLLVSFFHFLVAVAHGPMESKWSTAARLRASYVQRRGVACAPCAFFFFWLPKKKKIQIKSDAEAYN